MKNDRRDSPRTVAATPLPSKQRTRRDFLIKSGGALAAGTFGAVPLRGWAATPVNIGALYPITGSMAPVGVSCVAAAKLAVEMINEAGGIKSLGGAKLNLIVSDVQSDTTLTRTETERLITGNKLSAIHGCYASALTLIASEVCERARVPIITGSSSDQLNRGRSYTFTPFARASQFAKTQLQMSKLAGDRPRVAVIFENTAFGTSTSNVLKELAPAEGVEIVMFEPYSAGFTDALPLINKVRTSGANALFSVSYLNDLILIVRTVKQVGLNVAINGGSGGLVMPDFYKNVGQIAEGLQGIAHWNHDISDDARKVNAEYKKRTGDFLFEYAGGLVAQTFMLADALERAGSADPQKVRDALTTLDVSNGYAAMAPGGKVKFGPDGKNIYGHPVGVQWQNGDLASVFPDEVKHAPQPAPRADFDRRVALVIGNSTYKNVPALPNPARDAAAVADVLRRLGFQSVTLQTDLGREALINALRDFARTAQTADWAVVYFAGHGMEVGGVNYLLPVDAVIESDLDMSFAAVPLSQVLNATERAQKLRVVILDACRSNPYAARMKRTDTLASRGAVSRGFARVEPDAGTLVVYAAKDGETASDGDGGNSPFTTALVKNLMTPGVEVRRLFDNVRDDVQDATRRQQMPYTYGSVTGRQDFYFLR